MNLLGVLEGLLFIYGDEGCRIEDICKVLNINEDEAKKLLVELKNSYEDQNRGLRIRFLGNAFKLTTKEEHKEYYKKLALNTDNSLSESALEVLAIIAYNEPITRVEIDEIRGLQSDYMLRKLIALGMVKESGKSTMPGRPNLYKTTDYFLDYFNLPDLSKLPEIDTSEIEILDDKDLYESKYTEIEE